jgi:hypothetical protein
MLFGAVADLPYDYYTLLRWLVSGVAAYGAFLAKTNGSDGWLWSFLIIAVLFNPIVPVHLTRQTWAPIDVGTGVVMLISIWRFPQPPVIRKDEAISQPGRR